MMCDIQQVRLFFFFHAASTIAKCFRSTYQAKQVVVVLHEATEKACSNPKRPEKNTVATLNSLPSQIQSVLDCCKTLTYPVPGTVWHITPDRYPRRGYGIMSRACETITKTRKRLGRPTPTKRDPRTSVTAHDH